MLNSYLHGRPALLIYESTVIQGLKPVLHYAFLSWVGSQNTKEFALVTLQVSFLLYRYDLQILRKCLHNL